MGMPITVAATDTRFDDQDLIIDGTTVTMDGHHRFTSLRLINGAILTHSAGIPPGLDNTVGTLTIDQGSLMAVEVAVSPSTTLPPIGSTLMPKST